MSKKIFKTWTNEEITLLKQNSMEDLDFLQLLFPDRSIKSIRHKINNMKLPRKVYYRRYSVEEDEILKNNSNLPVSKVKELLNDRTVESIIQRYNNLGVEWTKTWEFWTDEEIEIIKVYNTTEEMSEYLPNRTISSIHIKANEIGKQLNDYWTDDEINILYQNYGKINASEIIELLPNRSEQSIYNKANELDLKGNIGRRDIADDRVIELFNEGNHCAEISRVLSISVGTVMNRLKRNNIKFERKILYGEDRPSWKGGITPENKKIRGSIEFQIWRKQVFERDNYTCQCCGDNKGGNLCAHHIENFSDHEDLRFDTENGITLCNNCHNPSVKGSFHHTYGTRNNNQEQLIEYINSHQMLSTNN